MEKKETDAMEIEGVDIEHINKDKEFQKVTFDFLEPDEKYTQNLTLLLRKTFGFVSWNFIPVI